MTGKLRKVSYTSKGRLSNQESEFCCLGSIWPTEPEIADSLLAVVYTHRNILNCGLKSCLFTVSDQDRLRTVEQIAACFGLQLLPELYYGCFVGSHAHIRKCRRSVSNERIPSHCCPVARYCPKGSNTFQVESSMLRVILIYWFRPRPRMIVAETQS